MGAKMYTNSARRPRLPSRLSATQNSAWRIVFIKRQNEYSKKPETRFRLCATLPSKCNPKRSRALLLPSNFVLSSWHVPGIHLLRLDYHDNKIAHSTTRRELQPYHIVPTFPRNTPIQRFYTRAEQYRERHRGCSSPASFEDLGKNT